MSCALAIFFQMSNSICHGLLVPGDDAESWWESRVSRQINRRDISDVICIVPPLPPAKCQPFVSLVSMVCADLLTDNLGFITNNSCLIPCVVLTHRRSVGAKNPGVSKQENQVIKNTAYWMTSFVEHSRDKYRNLTPKLSRGRGRESCSLQG